MPRRRRRRRPSRSRRPRRRRTTARRDRKSTLLNSSHLGISYAVFCLKKKKNYQYLQTQHDLFCTRLSKDVRLGVSKKVTYAGADKQRKAEHLGRSNRTLDTSTTVSR